MTHFSGIKIWIFFFCTQSLETKWLERQSSFGMRKRPSLQIKGMNNRSVNFTGGASGGSGVESKTFSLSLPFERFLVRRVHLQIQTSSERANNSSLTSSIWQPMFGISRQKYFKKISMNPKTSMKKFVSLTDTTTDNLAVIPQRFRHNCKMALRLLHKKCREKQDVLK